MKLMKKWKYIAAALALVMVAGLLGFRVSEATEGAAKPPAPAGPLRRAYWRALGIKTAKLRIKTVDAITMKPIPGAGCVIGETGDRVETDNKGVAPMIDAPVFRNPRLEQMLAELHGELLVICYKNGYRDAIYRGVRMHEGTVTEPEVWMHPFGGNDRRIEPTLYQMPVHRIWQIELADKYRLHDEGEGRESPKLTRPKAPPAPQSPQGGGVQIPPPQKGPAAPPAGR